MFTAPRGPELFTVREHVVVFAHVPGLHRSFTPPALVCRCWALALFGGNSETGFDQNTTYSIFSISITLTDEGFQSFYQVKRSLHLFSPLFCLSGRREKKRAAASKIPTHECVEFSVIYVSLCWHDRRLCIFFSVQMFFCAQGGFCCFFYSFSLVSAT